MSSTRPIRRGTWLRVFAATLPACLLCVVTCAPAFSLDRDRSIAQFTYTFWSEKDGAPSEISSLAQTQDGYLWIGSERGLFRFDGVKFEEYAPPPGVNLPSHSIYSLMATPDGGLWIAFEPNGIGFYKDGSLTVFTRPGQLPDTPVHCFARDNNGTIWAGTETGLAFRQDDRWISVGKEWNFTPEMIRYVSVDREGTLWAATDKRLVYLKPGSKRFELGGPIGGAVTTLAQAPNGREWLADDGVDMARPVPTEGHDSTASGPSIAAQGLRELLFDKDGALWMTRGDLGIMRVRYPGKLEARRYGSQDREIESFGPKDGFPAGFAYKLLEDREGNIWAGCSNGLIRFRHNQVVPFALPQDYIRLTLLTGAQGDLWVGTTEDKPLMKIRGDSMTPETGGNIASSVFRDASGDVWWGSRTGVWRQRGSAFTYFRLPKNAEPGRMWDIMPTTDNRGIWIKLDDDGLVRFNNGTWDLHDWPRGFPSVGGTFKYGPSASFRDPSGRFWLGYTSGQIYLVDREHPTEYEQKDGLDLGRIKVIRGQTDHIWAGGELGLEFFSNGRFWKVQPTSGEPFGAVSGIIETPDSGLWLNEMKGIVQIPPEEIRQVLADPSHRVSCRRFDYLDGLPGTPQMSYTNSTAARTTDGRLWFATDSGLAWIDPAHLARNPIPPPVSITYISSENGREALSGPIKFAAGTHSVEIDYAGLSLSIPERVHFRYKLEGTDTGWQNVGTRRQAYYNNLGPGSYRFRVIACNNDGVWNDAGATLDFFIAPAYWQTNWFRALCLIAFLAMLWIIYNLRVRAFKQRHALLQQHRTEIRALNEKMIKTQEAERMRIAGELHDSILQQITALILRLAKVKREVPPESEAVGTIGALQKNLIQIGTDIRQVSHQLHPALLQESGLPVALSAYCEEFSNVRGIPVTCEADESVAQLSPGAALCLYRIAQEALGNAAKYSKAKQVEVRLTRSNGHVGLSVSDDGIGCAPDEIVKSGGLGVINMRERVLQLNGTFEFESEPGRGTRISVTIPFRAPS